MSSTFVAPLLITHSDHCVCRPFHIRYSLEPAEGDPRTVVVSIPVDVGAGVRTLSEVPMWEQLSLAAFFQRHWADNQVSATVTFDPKTEAKQLPHALEHFQYQLKVRCAKAVVLVLSLRARFRGLRE